MQQNSPNRNLTPYENQILDELLIEINNDELLNQMMADPISSQYANQRINEIFDYKLKNAQNIEIERLKIINTLLKNKFLINQNHSQKHINFDDQQQNFIELKNQIENVEKDKINLQSQNEQLKLICEKMNNQCQVKVKSHIYFTQQYQDTDMNLKDIYENQIQNLKSSLSQLNFDYQQKIQEFQQLKEGQNVPEITIQLENRLFDAEQKLQDAQNVIFSLKNEIEQQQQNINQEWDNKMIHYQLQCEKKMQQIQEECELKVKQLSKQSKQEAQNLYENKLSLMDKQYIHREVLEQLLEEKQKNCDSIINNYKQNEILLKQEIQRLHQKLNQEQQNLLKIQQCKIQQWCCQYTFIEFQEKLEEMEENSYYQNNNYVQTIKEQKIQIDDLQSKNKELTEQQSNFTAQFEKVKVENNLLTKQLNEVENERDKKMQEIVDMFCQLHKVRDIVSEISWNCSLAIDMADQKQNQMQNDNSSFVQFQFNEDNINDFYKAETMKLSVALNELENLLQIIFEENKSGIKKLQKSEAKLLNFDSNKKKQLEIQKQMQEYLRLSSLQEQQQTEFEESLGGLAESIHNKTNALIMKDELHQQQFQITNNNFSQQNQAIQNPHLINNQRNLQQIAPQPIVQAQQQYQVHPKVQFIPVTRSYIIPTPLFSIVQPQKLQNQKIGQIKQ